MGLTIGVQALDVENVDRRRQRESAGRQHHTAQHVEADPHAPGELIGQVGEAPSPWEKRTYGRVEAERP